jgi:hypothetical protein
MHAGMCTCRYYKHIANPPWKMQDVPLDLSCTIDIDFYCLKYKRSLWVLLVEPYAKKRKEKPTTQSIEMSKNNPLPYSGVMASDAESTQADGTESARNGILLLSIQQKQSLSLSDMYQPIVAALGGDGDFADIAAWNIIHKLSCAGISNLAMVRR